MSAQDQMRSMLDELMGTSRNGEPEEFCYKFTDPQVCKSYLLKCCPHEILSSTRLDLGSCVKYHDPALRADYEIASKQREFFYDVNSMEHLQHFIDDCDARTENAKKRLAETQEELTAEVAAKANYVHELATEIGKKLAKAEQLGAEGHVDKSMKLMEEVEDLRKQKVIAEAEYRNAMPASSYQQQKLRVCEVCSAYLGIHDNDRRLADHFGGKLHLGFIEIREKLEQLKNQVESRLDQRAVARANQVRDRYRQYERERERPPETEGDRSDRDKERRRRSRSRDRRRSSRRSRSRSRERRRRRSRSRDRKSRSRSRSQSRHSRRRRSRSHSRRSRS